jgi:hypothetical protein
MSPSPPPPKGRLRYDRVLIAVVLLGGIAAAIIYFVTK